MGILKRLFVFVFQYSQGICGNAIIKEKIRTVLSGSQIQLLWIGSKIIAILSLFCFVEQKLMCVTRRYETTNGNLNTIPGAEALKCGTEDRD